MLGLSSWVIFQSRECVPLRRVDQSVCLIHMTVHCVLLGSQLASKDDGSDKGGHQEDREDPLDSIVLFDISVRILSSMWCGQVSIFIVIERIDFSSLFECIQVLEESSPISSSNHWPQKVVSGNLNRSLLLIRFFHHVFRLWVSCHVGLDLNKIRQLVGHAVTTLRFNWCIL